MKPVVWLIARHDTVLGVDGDSMTRISDRRFRSQRRRTPSVEAEMRVLKDLDTAR